jgi:hypothetical protein
MSSANAISSYCGNDSYGRGCQRAQRDDGVWFTRGEERGYKGHNVISKWVPFGSDVEYPTEIRNLIQIGDAPDYVPVAPENLHKRVRWGFNTLRLVEDGSHSRLRLPKTKIEA